MTESAETCLYAAVSAPRERHEELLREMIAPVVAEIRGHPDLDSLFFVRYAEPDWQVRFRVLGRPAWIEESVRPRVERAIRPFAESGAIAGVTFGEYVREWERYGGPVGMRLAEGVFLHDSLACLALLEAETRGALGKSRREWSLVFTEGFLDLLDLDATARREFYREGHRWAFREEVFRDEDRPRLEARYLALREGLRDALAARRGGDAVTAYGGIEPARIARESLDATRPLIARMRSGCAAGEIVQEPAQLAWSYAHLHCNRLGFDLAAEAILRYVMFRFYEEEAASASPDSGPAI